MFLKKLLNVLVLMFSVIVMFQCRVFADTALTINLKDKDTGEPLPCKIWVKSPKDAAIGWPETLPALNPYMIDHPAGNIYYKPWCSGSGSDSSGNKAWFFYASSFTVNVSSGLTIIRALHGFEYENKVASITCGIGDVAISTDILIARKINLPAMGWYNWDHHNHNIHGEKELTVSARETARICKAQGMNLAPMFEAFWDYTADGYTTYDELKTINDDVEPEKTSDFKACWATEEAGNNESAHSGAFPNEDVTASNFAYVMHGIMPDVYAQWYPPAHEVVPRGTLSAKYDYMRSANYVMFQEHAIMLDKDDYGGKPGILTGMIDVVYSTRTMWPYGGCARELPVSAALGKVDGMGIMAASGESYGGAIEVWYNLMNCGLHVSPICGVDNCMDRIASGDPGSRRTYTYLGPGLDFTNPATKPFKLLQDGIRAGHSFITNGPLVLFNVNDKIPGDSINLPGTGVQTLTIGVTVQCFVNSFSRVELIQSPGVIIKELYKDDAHRITSFTANTTVNVTSTTWFAVRVMGTDGHYWTSPVSKAFSGTGDPLGSNYWGCLNAHTNAVFVFYGSQRMWNQDSADFFATWINMWKDRLTWIHDVSAPQYGKSFDAYEAMISTLNAGLAYYTSGTASSPTISLVAALPFESSATVSWKTLNVNSDSRVYYGTNTLDSSSYDAAQIKNHSVTLTGLNISTKYYYSVQSADSGLTSSSSTFTFTTTAPDMAPPSISGATTTIVGSKSATIKWFTNKPATSQVGYGLSADSSSFTYFPIPPDMNQITTHTVQLTGLNPQTHYYYIALSTATNKVGAISGIKEFYTTILDTTPPVITNPHAESVAATSANIRWATDELSISSVAYGITKTSLNLERNLGLAVATDHIVALTGLTSNSSYYFAVVSMDADGNVASSGTFSFCTLTPTIVLAVSNVSAGNITRTGATISWFTNLNSDSAVDYGITAAYGSNKQFVESITTHTVTLSDLIAGTTYHFQVKSTVGVQTASSLDYTFSTNSAAKPPIAIPEKTICYPNPIKLSGISAGNKRSGLSITGQAITCAEVRIYTLTGELIKVITETGGESVVYWDGTNQSGQKVTSGVYVYRSKNAIVKATGRFTVLR